jgi:hypothetical protein
MGKSKTKKNSKRSKHAKTRRGRRQSRKRRAGSRDAATNGCSGVSSGVRVGQKRIDLSNWSPYNPGTGIYRGEVDCGDKEPNGRGRASGNGTWESNDLVYNGANELYNGSSNIAGTIRSGTIISGKWKNNLPYDVTVKNNMGTYNYKKESYDLIEDNVRSSSSSRPSMDSDRSSLLSRYSMSSRPSMDSDRSSLLSRYSVSSRPSMDSDRSSILSMLGDDDDVLDPGRPMIVRGSWHAKNAKKSLNNSRGGRRSNKRKTRRRNHKH